MNPDWMENLNIPQLWQFATGKNVGVAVIDTGISFNNPDLIFNAQTFFVYDPKISLKDTQGHGTHCAGLIGAKNSTGNNIGVAPGCNLFVCKISQSASLDEAGTTRYADAINWCAEQNDIHVISISWGSFIFTQSIIDQIQNAINNAVAKNKIVVCAAGDASQFNDPGPIYPASLENTIVAGSIPVEKILYPYITKNLTTIIDGMNISSYDLNGGTVDRSGTSQSNAIIAGIIALLVETKKNNTNTTEIKKILTEASVMKTFKEIQLPVLDKDLLLKQFQSQTFFL